MSLFQIFVLIGLFAIIFALYELTKNLTQISFSLSLLGSISMEEKKRNHGNVLYEIERLLFGIRYQIPFIEFHDKARLKSMKDDAEEFPDELNEWFGGWERGTESPLLYKIDEIKEFLKSIDENLKRLNGERIKEPLTH